MGNKVYKIGFISLLVLNILLTLVIWRGPKPPLQEAGMRILKIGSAKIWDFQKSKKKVFCFCYGAPTANVCVAAKS